MAAEPAQGARHRTRMSQLGLFEQGPRVLFDDPTGQVTYVPGWASAGDAARWFAALRAGIDWRAERRLMYDRDVDVPRLLASYRLADPALPAPLGEIAARVRAGSDVPFSGVGLNLYRDQHDSVAPHNDRLHELVPGQPIVLLSLGATRMMQIRAKQPPRRLLEIALEPGSLLTMSHAVQLHYDHGIPKQRAPVGPRISLAFRVRRDR